jgi:alpha-amylase
MAQARGTSVGARQDAGRGVRWTSASAFFEHRGMTPDETRAPDARRGPVATCVQPVRARSLLASTLLLGLAPAAPMPAAGCNSASSDTVYSDLLDLDPVAVADKDSGLPDDWYRKAVFMEIYVRGYKDSDGDGIGDFRGLTEKLEYLKELGIGGIWLMPITESWDDDHGYATENYRAVESDYGTREDFQAFLAAAHEAGIGVIIDYVMNHSAADNYLFIDSLRSKGDKRDWYVWSPTNPGWVNWGGSPSWHPGRGGFYYGVFWDRMPDFNLRNEEVLQYHFDNVRYWLNEGVDGFRFDAVGTFVENGGSDWESQPENYQIMGRVRDVLGAYSKRFLICEEPARPQLAAQDDACGSAFAFGLNYELVASAQGGATRPGVPEYLDDASISQMGIILANHDFFAGDRLIKQFGGNETKYRLAAATALTLPGIPFVYYGEEIGIGTTVGQNGGDWAIRSPMSWTGDAENAGFTTGTPFRRVADNVATHNVEIEKGKPESLLSFYQAMIALRNTHESLSVGDFVRLQADEVLAFRRAVAGEASLVVINYGAETRTLALDGGTPDQVWTRVHPADQDMRVADPGGLVTVEAAPSSVQVFVAATP